MTLHRDHFVTFFIDESHTDMLRVITEDTRISQDQYQVIYTPTSSATDTPRSEGLSVGVQGGLLEHSNVESFIPKSIFLNHSQSQITGHSPEESTTLYLLNHNLKDIQNDISSLNFSTVDLCLVDSFAFLDIAVCDLFDIPTVLTMVPALISKAEYHHDFWGTFLYQNDPYSLDLNADLQFGAVMTYRERVSNVVVNALHLLSQSVMARFVVIPMLGNLNSVLRKLQINKLLDISKYGSGYTDFWDRTVIIGSLAPPFTPTHYHRNRVKQFGFLLSPQWRGTKSEEGQKLMEWVESEETPILLISMGSLHELPAVTAYQMYMELVAHSLDHQYRIIWSMKQQIDSERNNKELQKSHFKILTNVPQFELLQNEKVVLFLTHCGEGSVTEAIYTKTLMALMPTAADQYFNAERVEQLGGGLVVRDARNVSDLKEIIQILMLDGHQREYYQEKLNKTHEMIAFHGGVKEAVDFIEYVSRFGTDHLMCTYGVGFDCREIDIPWYQRTLIDLYVCSLVTVLMGTVVIKQCILDRIMCKRQSTTSPKIKTL